jgi:N6-adenosine-specific RNA methylase IME4
MALTFEWDILAKAAQIRTRKRERRRVKRVEKLSQIAAGNGVLNLGVRYPVIYADPPWQYEHPISDTRKIENHYPTMTLDAICALPVAAQTTDDAVLFLWATSPKLDEAMRVIKSWGFVYRTCAVWNKGQIGMGYYFRQQHELLLVASKGSPPMADVEMRPGSVFFSPRTEHSEKPPVFYTLIEKMYPTYPKLELFARTTRSGWSSWGNQVAAAGHVEIAVPLPL